MQDGCEIRGILQNGRIRSETLRGNTITITTTVAADGLESRYEGTFTGDRATATLTVTAPYEATCTFTGQRVTFPGATRYCCDVGARDCGTGQRCNPVAVGTGGGFFATACVPDGTVARGAACMRTMSVAGADNCAAGTYCGNFDNASTTERTCQPLCSEASQCAAGESCGRIGLIPPSGVCRRRCTPLGTDCAGASSCRPYIALASRDGRATVEPTCVFTGMGGEGSTCQDSFGCMADLVCQYGPTGGVCRRVCDATHACGAGMRCEDNFAAAGIANPTGLGGCVPMT